MYINSKYSEELAGKTKTLFLTVREYSIYAEQNNILKYDLQEKLYITMQDLTYKALNIIKEQLEKIVGDTDLTGKIVVMKNAETLPPEIIVKNIFVTIFYDLVDKMEVCEETRKMLIHILKNAQLGHPGLKISYDEDTGETFYYIVKSQSSKIMELLINVCSDDAFIIDFLKEYIDEIINIKRYRNILEILNSVNWEKIIMVYIEELILENY